MVYWMYFLPLWLSGIITVVVFCAFGVIGLVLTRRWVPSLHHASVSYNDIVGYYFGAITLLYGITLSLLLVGDWSTLADTQQRVDQEASTLAALYLDVSKYPEPYRGRLQNDLRVYVRRVIDVSWPELQKGEIPRGNLVIVENFLNDLAAFEPTSEGQKVLHVETFKRFNDLEVLHVETFKRFNDLEERRTARLFSVTASLSGALWALVYIGAAINIAVTWCFHLHNQRMHLWMTAMTSSLFGVMIFLLGAMDHPYRGQISVSPKSFELIYDNLMKPDAIAPGSLTPPTPQTH